jgi:hypothetical protein
VKYANTDFSEIQELNPPKELNGGGFDFNTHVINRINYGNVWYALATLPRVPLEEQKTDIIESHWPNWLAQDDVLQPDVTAQWIGYYKSAQRMPDRYIAKNTEQLHAQWLYNKYTTVTEATPGTVEIDNTAMPEQAYTFNGLGNMVLKVKLTHGQHLTTAILDGRPLAVVYEDEGYGFLYLPPLDRKKYILQYSIGPDSLPVHIFHDGTYNVYDATVTIDSVAITLRVYGQQQVNVRCPKPVAVRVDAGALVIQNDRYDEGSGYLTLDVKAADMQGSTGTIIVSLV